jgi:outer membrane protein assembly factor BamB
MRSRLAWCSFALLAAGLALFVGTSGRAQPGNRDVAFFGVTPSRNLVNTTDKDPPTDWNAEDGKFKNVRWAQAIGTRGYVGPVVAGGRVFVSTNNNVPRDPRVTGKMAVLMCFDAKDGKFLWQAVHDMAPLPVNQQAIEDGLCSSPAVEGDRLYFVTPAAKVVCAGVKDGKPIWSYDMMKELKVFPCIISNCSPLPVGDTLFVMTGNGVDEKGKVVAPEAPSFVALNKKDGTLKWQNNLPGDKIIHGQWGNPAYVEAAGKKQALFPGGDGYLYSLEADTGKLIWKFRCTPANEKGVAANKRNYPITTPVVYDNKVYLGIGAAPESGAGNRSGHFWCIDATKTGDVSPADGDFDPKSNANKKSALVWHVGGEIQPRPKTGARRFHFGQTLSTAAVAEGLVYIAEEDGYLDCFDAATGKKYWEYDFKAGVWGSPYWAGGKIYIGGDDSALRVFAHGKQMKLIRSVEMDDPIHSTPTVADNVLYVTTKAKVFAIGGGK